MKLAIKISKKGVGKVNPNPLVGAVIVKDNKIIGQGYHEYYGGNHAEVNAFENLSDNPEGATIYVTLEPCSHYGKTPPCVDKIIDNKISKVVIGTLDPTLKEVTISRDLKDTFIIKRKNTEIIIQEGKLLNREVLSSGTAEKIDVAPYFEERSVVILCKVMGKSDFDQKSVDENVYEWYQEEGVHSQYYGEIVKVLVKDYK